MKVKYKNDIAVIGTGRFGSAVIDQLIKLGKNILVIDKNEEEAKNYSDEVQRVVIADAADMRALKGIRIDQMETVVVAVSDNIEIVAALLELNVKNIIARAKSERHARVLKQIGVSVIIRPEHEAGTRAALIAANNNFINYTENLFEFESNYVIGTTKLKNVDLTLRPIRELKLTEHGISIVLIKRNGSAHMATASGYLEINDSITIIGNISDVTTSLKWFNQEQEETNQVETQ
ncbi:potassium channel family protein [Mycoplasmopsis gallopavonis]|uniref:Potassium uptake protein A n=1 Tax=Mycoplasmopsis gallopavonis TaxID=76629 RepID=A0A449AZ64_9BACT|nr:TrkA family potassium uptake protein [Mycoplasmopsis gallopavonis]RIV16662.1 TrkA family potassium uptake protein [Mycoplasmopsis gallopavonis]VEU72839.1 potassium uptake protein A [Mycoplasmopsis gallopavonis]